MVNQTNGFVLEFKQALTLDQTTQYIGKKYCPPPFKKNNHRTRGRPVFGHSPEMLEAELYCSILLPYIFVSEILN